MKKGDNDIDRLRELTENLVEAPLYQQFQDVGAVPQMIQVEVQSGYAAIRLLARDETSVVAIYGAVRGTTLERSIRNETWIFVILSGELTVVQDGQATTYQSREVFAAVSGQAYTLSWEEDSRMAVIAIPDVKELLGVSHAA